MKAKLTLVSAQAGYGKTTALSTWVRQCSSPVAWISLDKQDNDWMQFWRYVLASIRETIPGFGLAVEPLLETGPSVSVEPAIMALLNELDGLTGEWVIVLDDYHMIEFPAIQQSMICLLEHLPPHIHLYIASRTDLTIPTARLLAQGEYHRISMQDLCFQLDEGLAFFQETTDLSLTREQVTELYHQTEGWISGLQLAAISLKRSDSVAETLHQFSGQQHHIADYLLEEIFHQQSEPMRAFLLETSILSRMNHEVAQAVTGQPNGQEQFERLEQQNLFIIPLDDHRNWYRYHHLLADFLQQLLFRNDRDRWMRVHHRAAKWLEDHGFDEEAVEHYLEAEQVADAVRLIEANLHALLQSKSVALHRWVSRLPENAFAEKPRIELFYISVLLGVGLWEAASNRVRQATVRFQAMKGIWSDAEWNEAIGHIYFFCAVTAYLQKDLEQTSAYFELMESCLPEGSFFQTMGRNRYQGYDLFDDHLAFIQDLHEGHAFLLKWIAVWGQKDNYPFVGLLYASCSKLLYEWDRLEEAEWNVNQVLGRQDMHPFARIMIQIAISASRIQQALGHPERASGILAQLKAQIDSPDYELLILNVDAEQACLSLRQGSLEPALEWLQRCGLSHTDEVSLSRVQEHLALARVLAAGERLEDALYILRRLNELLTKEDRLRDRIKVNLLMSVTLQRLGRTEAAFVQLETALQLAEPGGYVRSFVDEGAKMTDLLAAYMKARHTPPVSLAYIRQLLQALPGSPDTELLRKDILTDQETRILRLIAGGLSNKEMAHALNITGETVKSHIKNIYRKLGVKNRIQALQRAAEFMLLH
ncbi:LuxR C-terminal-related transcriptional regulator [Paenibacillus filicis]|uniref:LuxR C-terminal-related transcriptional regulator n=1 Tax=Paenibacillus filicis TaxID=669464 RepID=A0ABU9DGU6_9BACL